MLCAYVTPSGSNIGSGPLTVPVMTIANNGADVSVCTSGQYVLTAPVDQSGWLTGQDGLILGWAIAGVWLSVYAVKYLANIFKDSRDE